MAKHESGSHHRDRRRPGDSTVLIRVEATALNAIDLHLAAGQHRAGRPRLPSPNLRKAQPIVQQYCAEIGVPYLPGMERAGVIVDGPDAGLRVRAMAAAGPAPGVDGGLAEIARPFPVPGGHAEVGASVGIASSPPGGPEEQELIRRAGIAMYQAKRGGRGRRVTYRGAMDASSTVAPWPRAPRWRHGRELHGGAMDASSTVVEEAESMLRALADSSGGRDVVRDQRQQLDGR